MKKIKILIVILSLLSVTALQASAEETQSLEGTMRGKLKRGLTNIITCPLEIPAQIGNELDTATERKAFKPFAFLVGTLKGVALTVVRLSAGVIETVTCNVPYPDKEYGPILNPEHVCTHFKDAE